MFAVKRRRVRHDEHQATFVDVSHPLRSYQGASNVVGEFFELLTARMVRGQRQGVFGAPGENPDVVNAAGRTYESKAAGRERWLLEEGQLNLLEQTPNASYVLWRYQTPAEGGLCRYRTAGRLRAWLATAIRDCHIMPATFPRQVLAGTPHAEPRSAKGAGKFWGSNYWFRCRYLQEILDGDRKAPMRFLRRTWPCDLGVVAGVEISTFPVTRLFAASESAPGGCPRCGRRRQPPCDVPTPDDQRLAAIALDELEQQRCRIGLVPAPDPHFVGHKIRVVESVTPAWYRVLWDRRNYNVPKHWGSKRKKGQRAYHSIRGYVTRALEVIVGGCIRTQHRAMDREILEVLHEWDGGGGR